VPFLPPGPATREPGDAGETREKLGALRDAMLAAELEAVYLERWQNVAWLCGGRGNRVVLDSPAGQCGLLVTHNGALVLTPNNERARVETEAFAGLPLPVASRPWAQLPLWQAAASRVPAPGRWAADVDADGADDAEGLIAPLRRRLGEADLRRYRALGQDATEALEAALLEARPGWSELEVAGTLAAALKARGIEAPVVLVGTRARTERYRHLVPTQAVVEGGLIASVTAIRHGLHASVTRCLSFGEPPPAVVERHAAAVAVDRAYLRASRPGATLGEAFRAGEAAYTEAGYYGDWEEHHQGGTAGYAGREVFATEDSEEPVGAGTVLAWNPTVPGAKSEDTVLVTGDGLELLTRGGASPWPWLDPAGDDGLPRAGILVV